MIQDIRLYGSPEVWDQPLQEGQRNLLQAIADFWPAGIESVLDVGCGDGKLTSRLQGLGIPTLVGLDSSAEALSRLPFASVIGNAQKLPFPAGAFDLVMTTDVLEHMPPESEAAAWQELFRVAGKVVMVAVPFREELLDATTRCKACEHLYHVNWHQRSYDIADLHRRCPPGWHIGATVLSGEPWSAMLPPETHFRRRVFNEWSGWELAICPSCASAGQAAAVLQPLPPMFAQGLGAKLYPALSEQRYCRSHSEILVIFQRDETIVELSSPRLSEPRAQAASMLDFVGQPEVPDLQPFCQVAQHATGTDGQWRVQFPLYEENPVLHVMRLPGSKGALHLLLEDAQGLLLNGCVLKDGEERFTHPLPRQPVAGYYGILASCPKHEPFASLQLGESPSVLWNDRSNDDACHYLPVDGEAGPVFVQLARPLWFDPQTLSGKSATIAPSAEQILVGVQECLASTETQGQSALRVQIQNLAAGRNAGTNGVVDESKSERLKDHMRRRGAANRGADVLMLCHDQHLDRRVVAQAVSLISRGHRVHLLALSFDSATHHEQTPEGIHLTRIGLNDIIPENPTYKGFMARQHKLNRLAGWVAGRLGGRIPFVPGLIQRIGSRVNWMLYKTLLLKRYKNRHLHDPLPFRQAFVRHGLDLPCDVVQVHDLPALEAGSELAARWGVPLVYDAHELYPEQKSFSEPQRLICSQAEAEHVKKADLVFAVNESIGDEMARRYQIEKPVTLLNAIDPPAGFDPTQHYDLLREELGLGAERRILLFQGGFAPNRSLEILIQAMAHVTHADVDLVMMGFGPFGEVLKTKAKRLNLMGTRVHFLNAVPQSELLQHSASADLGIIPYPHVDLNSYYCTPNKLFEFIQAGLPILANDSPELNRFVQGNEFGYSAKMNSAKDIALAIDAAFSSDRFPLWRNNLKQKRQGLAWSSQDVIYVNEMNRFLHAGAVDQSSSVGVIG